MVEQGVIVEVGGGEMAMASSSTSNCTLPPKAASPGYFLYPPPLATYEEVVASPAKFRDTLEKLHAAMGSKFMIPTVGGQELDLHRLFVEVTYRGGLAKILQDKKWKDVTGVFSFPSSATNASFILRKYYYSLLIHYEQIYFFRAVGWNPETINALQRSSRTPAPSRESSEPLLSSPSTQAASSEPLLSSPSTQAAESHAFGVNAKSWPEACSALAVSSVHGVIDGKFENGYLVTVKIGSEEFRGVLYQTKLEPAHQEELRPSSQQCQIVSVDNNSNSVSASRVVRRKRRKKSEIRKRDPAHPKPNRSGYNFFFAEQHARLKPLHPGKDREISRMIGELWNKLNETEKSIYQEKAARDKERYRMEMEGYRERLRTGQMISNAMPIQQLPPEPSINVMDMEKKLENEDANAPHAPWNVTSSSMVGKSNLVPSSEQTINNAIPMQLQSLQPEINVMDLEKNLHADGENSLSIPEKESSSSNKSDKSNLDESTSQILNDTILVQQQPCDIFVNTIDLEKEFQSDGANSPTMPENEISSTKTWNINLNASSMMILNDTIPVQQQRREIDVNVMDQNQKLQTKVPENETSSDDTDKNNSEDNRSLVNDREMEVSGGAKAELVNTAKEISDDEQAFELQKGMERDTKEDKECDERISHSIEGNLLPPSEERLVVPTTAEDIVLSHA